MFEGESPMLQTKRSMFEWEPPMYENRLPMFAVQSPMYKDRSPGIKEKRGGSQSADQDFSVG